ncbi:ribonuclease H family protein [Ammoniphilus sp. CFH 90114]|uniref:ribonuclease H family protein n=1 Tax=Ammoniphilus sp. CFH 90114 TaxID=2493665 RepID=UPI0013E905E6|nr:ribonuclease H family protein [Ammoniphilus sp. CFH 90114]
MGKLFYAVKVGREPGIFRKQKQALNQVRDFSRGEWCRFPTFEQAEQYLRESVCNIDYDWLIRERNKKWYRKKVSFEELSFFDELALTQEYSNEEETIIAYTDGSAYKDYAAYGVVIVKDQQVIHQISGIKRIHNQKSMSLIAEILAVEASVQYAIEQQKKKIAIFHDLSTLGLAAYGQVHINTILYRDYQQFITEALQHIDIHFVKVKGHSENPYNNLADQLAKDLINKKKKK